MSRFIPSSIDSRALQKSKSVFPGENIDLFNDKSQLLHSGSIDIMDSRAMDLKKLIQNNNMLKELIQNLKKARGEDCIEKKYCKIHGQKHWINLKESLNRTRPISDLFKLYENANILQFNDSKKNLKKPVQLKFSSILTTNLEKSSNKIPVLNSFKVLDAPGLRNDFYSNLLSWSKTDKLAVGLNDCVYLWSKRDNETKLLLTSSYLKQYRDIITCVSYSPSLTEDLICCGTKNGRVLLLKGEIDTSNKNNICHSMFLDKEELKYLLCEASANSKGICTIKWFLPKKSLDGKEEWTVLCGNESGEVVCFDVIKITQQYRNYNSNFLAFNGESAESEPVISTIRSLHLNLDPLGNSEVNNLSFFSDFTTQSFNFTEGVDINSYSQLGLENFNLLNVFLRPQNFIANNRPFANNDITNVTIKLRDSSTVSSKLSSYSKKIFVSLVNKTRYELELKCCLKCQTQQLCGLDLNCEYGKDNQLIFAQLAVGGNDNSCTLWDITNIKKPKIMFDLQHTAAVKAVLFCPWLKNLLATGGGSKDRFIRIWHTQTGNLVKKYKTAGQITSLIWSRHKMELMLTFGFGNPEQPVLMKTFKYPSMQLVNYIKAGEHIRVLSSALSPDHSTIALATNDETIKFFKVSSKNKIILKQCNNKDIYESSILNFVELEKTFEINFFI